MENLDQLLSVPVSGRISPLKSNRVADPNDICSSLDVIINNDFSVCKT